MLKIKDGNYVEKKENDHVIYIFELDLAILLGKVAESSAHYVNAKVVLVGDTGVGKTGLSLVLNNQPFGDPGSTPGRRVWTLDSQEVKVEGGITQTRETLLWDLAGQPGYRVIHQLHLNEVAVALVVFDARSEIDPLAGVRHWERALRLAQQRQGTSGVPMKKFLVSTRNDRGGVSISEERMLAILKEFGFDGYFKTSAMEGWQINELRSAIEQAIHWEDLPEVSSSQLFADIKSFLLEVKKTGQLLAPAITFDGPVQSLYATLAVRLGHSGLFTTGRAEMWRNAAVFTANAGGKCGLFLNEFAEARGRLILFFDEQASPETRFHFEEFVLAHAKRRVLDGTLDLVRFFVCSNGHPVPDDYVKLLLAQGKKEFTCPCGATVSLWLLSSSMWSDRLH